MDGPDARARIEARIDACAPSERALLLSALDGRRVPPGPAGAPTRGRLDVLPTGRNLTVTDPRAFPTETAAALGQRAANEVIRRHRQDHGEPPRCLMIDLWASATLRTGGEEIAQAMAFLGVRPTWERGAGRVTGIESVPLAKLDRPRIDVTIRMSGLFRDLFETQMTLLKTAVDLVAGLDEDDDWNPLAAARRRGDSLDRIFSGAPGTYGAGAAAAALDGRWQSRGDLADAYISASSYAYGGGNTSGPDAPAFRARIASADALIHVQDDRERDLLDGDGVADYVGGFAAAAAELGSEPALYQLDTSRASAPRARTVAEEVARIVRGRPSPYAFFPPKGCSTRMISVDNRSANRSQ
jgi:cobaltochelatase CobN